MVNRIGQSLRGSILRGEFRHLVLTMRLDLRLDLVLTRYPGLDLVLTMRLDLRLDLVLTRYPQGEFRPGLDTSDFNHKGRSMCMWSE